MHQQLVEEAHLDLAGAAAVGLSLEVAELLLDRRYRHGDGDVADHHGRGGRGDYGGLRHHRLFGHRAGDGVRYVGFGDAGPVGERPRYRLAHFGFGEAGRLPRERVGYRGGDVRLRDPGSRLLRHGARYGVRDVSLRNAGARFKRVGYRGGDVRLRDAGLGGHRFLNRLGDFRRGHALRLLLRRERLLNYRLHVHGGLSHRRRLVRRRARHGDERQRQNQRRRQYACLADMSHVILSCLFCASRPRISSGRRGSR